LSFGFKINIYIYELFEMCLWHQNLEALEFAALVSIKIENVFLTLKKKQKKPTKRLLQKICILNSGSVSLCM